VAGSTVELSQDSTNVIRVLHQLTTYQRNPFIRWLVTIGRDNKVVIWKLFEGKIVHTDLAHPLYFPHSQELRLAMTSREGSKSGSQKSAVEMINSNGEFRHSLKMVSTLEWFYRLSKRQRERLNQLFGFGFLKGIKNTAALIGNLGNRPELR
jgi:hypothetical protein